MAFPQTCSFAVAGVLMLASLLPSTRAEEGASAIHVEADLARSCYSAYAGFGSLWMLSGDELDRIEPRDNSVRRVPVRDLQSWHGSVTVGEGAVWLGDARATIFKVDPKTDRVIQEIGVALDQSSTGDWGLAVGEGAVWAVVGSEKLGRYSAMNGAAEAVIGLPSNSSRTVVAFGSVWVSGTGNDELYRIDPATNHIVATIELRARPKALAAGEESVWVFNEGDGAVQRIDGKSGKEVATIETGAVGRAALAVGGGFVWVGTAAGDLIRIDPRTNAIQDRFGRPDGIPAGVHFLALAYGDNSLWMCGDAAYRIAPPR